MHGELAIHLARAAAAEESRTVIIGRSPYTNPISGACWALCVKQVHPWIYETLLKIMAEEHIYIAEIQHIVTAPEGLSFAADHDCIAFVTEADLQPIRGGCDQNHYECSAEAAFTRYPTMVWSPATADDPP